MRTTIVSLVLLFTSVGHATGVASCGADLAGESFLSKLKFTDWNSQHGHYGLMKIRGVRQAQLASGEIFYVFDGNDGATQIFRRESFEFDRYAGRRGWGGSVTRYVHRARLVEVGTNGEDIAGERLDVELTRENDGFVHEEWTFEKNGEGQKLYFYNLAEERAESARRSREEQRLAQIPDPGSKAGIRRQICDELRADGRDPARQHWIGDEVERQYADMWRHLTR